MSFLQNAKDLTVKWLNYLGLGDWDVTVEVGDLGPNLGECCADWKYLQALIRYRDPSLFRKGEYDLEAVVAHEVAHLPFSAFETEAGTWQRALEEHLVERFSRSMLRIVRGNPGMSQAKISERLRAIVGASVRARRAINDRRHRMDPKLLELLMKAGEFKGREDVPEDVKELLGQLAEAAVTGAAPEAATDPTEEPPAAEEPEEPDAPPAVVDEPDNAPAMRVARAAIDAKMAKSKRDVDAAAKMAAKSKALAESRLRVELFASAPDVFPEALPKAREPYAKAPPDEIERYINATRARVAPPAGGQENKGAKGRADVVAGAKPEPREPAPGNEPIANPGGMTVIIGGKRAV